MAVVTRGRNLAVPAAHTAWEGDDVTQAEPTWAELGDRRRTYAREVYRRDRDTPGYACPKCGQAIDWALKWPDPMSRSVDHIIERQDGGALLDLDNGATLHLGCNSRKGAQRRHEREREQRRVNTMTIAIDPTTL